MSVRHPRTRRMLRVNIQAPLETDRIVSELMGKHNRGVGTTIVYIQLVRQLSSRHMQSTLEA